MEIRTKHLIERKPVGKLEIMRAYIIFDSKTYENKMIIIDSNHEAIVLGKYENDNALCILKMSKDEYVDVIGQVDDLDIVNVRYTP